MNKFGSFATAFGVSGLVFLCLSCYVVQPGERSITFSTFSGLQKEIGQEGFHFKNPVCHSVIVYQIRDRGYDIETTAASKDLQNVHVKLRFIYSPKETSLIQIHKELGPNYADIVFPSISKEVLKSVIAKYTAEQVVTKREEVSDFIKQDIISRAAKFGIGVRDVALADVEFSRVFSEAIEQKQVAEQQLEASRKQAEAAIVKARGEAEAARIINSASQASENFIELRKIEAQKEIAKTLASSNNVIYLPNNAVMMMGHK